MEYASHRLHRADWPTWPYYLNKEFGIEVGTMTATHAYTSSQMLLDGPKRGKKDLRTMRAATNHTVPHSTGAAKAIGLLIPELAGRLNGHAQRVAVPDGSLTELVTVLKTSNLTVDQVNETIRSHTVGNESFSYNDQQIISSDVVGTTAGSTTQPRPKSPAAARPRSSKPSPGMTMNTASPAI
ncbi:hypothetical protein [Bifidobacterium aemilianum]|uniref:hypothetical protein n=1 Tax=Bifidobacterium aemilianum TaxID=2493120 RepID=UPI0038B3C33F